MRCCETSTLWGNVCKQYVLEITLRKAAAVRRIEIHNGTVVFDMKMKKLDIGFKCGTVKRAKWNILSWFGYARMTNEDIVLVRSSA